MGELLRHYWMPCLPSTELPVPDGPPKKVRLLGLMTKERASFVERCNADLVMALALIHHLAIGNNVPLERIASFSRIWLRG